MKKILFITAFPPNRKSAGQNYTRQFLDDISLNNEVHVICFDYPHHKTELSKKNIQLEYIHVNNISKFAGTILRPTLFPFFTTRFNLSLLNHIKKISSKYDILYFDFSQVFIYSLYVNHPTKILMAHDIITQKYNRSLSKFGKILKKFIHYTENRLLKTSSMILCFSDKDKSIIKTVYNLDAVSVSFYIDSSIYSIDLSNILIKEYFVFYGAWNRSENIEGLLWFIDNVIPILPHDYKFKIIGGGMHIEIQNLIEKQINIEYLGFVNDPYTILSNSQALIAPLFNGAGVKVKVIESLATGTPVIGTFVAFEGINQILVNGEDQLILANSNTEFANAIISFKNCNIKNKIILKNLFKENYSKNMAIDILNLR